MFGLTQDIIMFGVTGVLLGLVIGYETTITGGAIAGNFLNNLFPNVVHGRAFALEYDYCTYWAGKVKIFSYILQVSALVTTCGTILARCLLKSSSLKHMLLIGSVIHFIGSPIVGFQYLKPFGLLSGRVLHGLGLGILASAADLLLQKVPEELKEKVDYAYNLGLSFGPVIATSVNITLSQLKVTRAWRYSFSASGFLSFLLFTASVILDGGLGNPAGRSEFISSWSKLGRNHMPQLMISIVRTVVIPITDLNLYSTVLLMYFHAGPKTTYLVPLLLSLADAFGKMGFGFGLTRRRKLTALLSCLICAFMQISVGLSLYQALPRLADKRITRGAGIAALTLETVFWLCRIGFSHPSGWLRHGISPEVEIASSSITRPLDMLMQAIISSLTSIAVCRLGSGVFYVLAVLLFLLCIFIAVGVTETAHISTEEEEREEMRDYGIWKFC